MRLLSFCISIGASTLLPVVRVSAIDVSPHDREIVAFATIMAVTRTAAERCTGVTIDEPVIVAAKDRLYIVDTDYFAFPAEAHRLAEMLENDMVVASNPAWCSDAFRRFGPEGTELNGALRR